MPPSARTLTEPSGGISLLAEGSRGATTKLIQRLRDAIGSGTAFADALREPLKPSRFSSRRSSR
jgi:hypothetical protein